MKQDIIYKLFVTFIKIKLTCKVEITQLNFIFFQNLLLDLKYFCKAPQIFRLQIKAVKVI